MWLVTTNKVSTEKFFRTGSPVSSFYHNHHCGHFYQAFNLIFQMPTFLFHVTFRWFTEVIWATTLFFGLEDHLLGGEVDMSVCLNPDLTSTNCNTGNISEQVRPKPEHCQERWYRRSSRFEKCKKVQYHGKIVPSLQNFSASDIELATFWQRWHLTSAGGRRPLFSLTNPTWNVNWFWEHTSALSLWGCN